MLAEFRAGDKIRHTVLCRVQKVGNSSNGGVFARGFVNDNSATLPFVAFESSAVETIRALAGPAPLVASGVIDVNRFANDGSLQMLIQKVEQPFPGEDFSHLLPDGGVDLKKYEKKLEGLLGKINDPDVARLLQSVFSGPRFYSFKSNPAAMSYHHAYVGGLFEHSVDTAELALALAEKVKGADRDVVIAGALLHDIGKLEEISQEVGFPYTAEGKLLGHITLGAITATEVGGKLEPPMPRDKLQAIVHTIVAHHGEMEKGSPITCKTQEAFIVHCADELDSVLNQFRHAQGAGWQYNKMLGRNILVADS